MTMSDEAMFDDAPKRRGRSAKPSEAAAVLTIEIVADEAWTTNGRHMKGERITASPEDTAILIERGQAKPCL